MSNVFSEKDKTSPNLQRNAFDLSFQNNLTLPFGKIVPVFCKETLPGDSWDIDCALGLNFMPMVYPVQSKIYVNLHFYYVRNRALWKDWKDFIFKTKDGLVPPYIYQTDDSSFWGIGSLSDYFGIPTDFDTPIHFTPWIDMGYHPMDQSLDASKLYGNALSSNLQYYRYSSDDFQETLVSELPFPALGLHNQYLSLYSEWSSYSENPPAVDTELSSLSMTSIHSYPFDTLLETENPCFAMVLPVNLHELEMKPLYNTPLFSVRMNPLRTVAPFAEALEDDGYLQFVFWDGMTWRFTDKRISVDYKLWSPSGGNQFTLDINVDTTALDWLSEYDGTPVLPFFVGKIAYANLSYFKDVDGSFDYSPSTAFVGLKVARTSILQSHNPFGYNRFESEPEVRISALPFRAYESIFNAYYRNQQNDPFKINGEVEYNRFVTNLDGGKDTTKYDFFNRYWEPDFLTTCMPSPQQGVAPLVGVNAAGVFTFKNPDTLEEYEAQALIGEDGETLTGIGVHSPDMPQGSLRALMSAVQHGMSINDFRNVNSLQRWLETNLRRGYKYRDLMDAHFGIDIRYNELDMPEFIGGLSTIVEVQKVINQTEASGSSSLGSFAGLPTAFGQFKNRIQKYTDEHGFIIGVMSVAPVPTYTQVIPKFFLKDNTLDYYTPEFAKIGMQPVFNREVSPILANYENVLDDVFGYQKAWYDYMSSVDEAHGDFRGTLKNYVMYRTFGTTPELGKSFLDIDMSQVNDVFADTSNNDKIMGRINFQVMKKTVIPRHIIPGLE